MPWNFGLLGAAGSGLAGPFELLESEVLSGTQSSVIFSNLNAKYALQYKHLHIRGMVRSTENTTVGNMQLRFNSDSTSNYWNFFLQTNASNWSAFNFQSDSLFIGQTCGSTAPAGANNGFMLDILDAFNPNKRKATRSFYGTAGMTNQQTGIINGIWNQTAALSSIEILTISHSFAQNTRLSLYGMRGS